MRHDPFGPERHDNHRAAHDRQDGRGAKRATKQTHCSNDQQQWHREMGRLERMDDTGRTYLQWSPDFPGVRHATDCDVERVEDAQVHGEGK
jgi:hypothetical protein